MQSHEYGLQYAEVVHSGNSPAAPLPAELSPVKYATIISNDLQAPPVTVSLN